MSLHGTLKPLRIRGRVRNSMVLLVCVSALVRVARLPRRYFGDGRIIIEGVFVGRVLSPSKAQ
jgi:hypothetical protein